MGLAAGAGQDSRLGGSGPCAGSDKPDKMRSKVVHVVACGISILLHLNKVRYCIVRASSSGYRRVSAAVYVNRLCVTPHPPQPSSFGGGRLHSARLGITYLIRDLHGMTESGG